MSSLPSIDPKHETKKIVNFLKKTFKKQKINKVVLGLSGGIDSTVVLYLLKEVLPTKNILAIQMDYEPKKKLNIDLRGINIINVSIKKIVRQFAKNILEGEGIEFFFDSGLRDCEEVPAEIKKFDTEPLKKARLGNIMARIRMIILFDLAKQLDALVCGTENKSEKLLGYFTRFGDSASDIEPLSHLYKTQVYQLARHLGVIEEIINRPPSPDTYSWPVTDEQFYFCMPYDLADLLLYAYENHTPEKEVCETMKLTPEQIQRVFRDFKAKENSTWHLRQLPPTPEAGVRVQGSGEKRGRRA